MFPLAGKTFPTSNDELRAAIQDALARVVTFAPTGAGVSVEGGTFPDVASIRIDLSGATVKADQPPPPRPVPTGQRLPGITLGRLDVSGHPIFYQSGKASLDLHSEGLRLDFAQDADGNPLLVLADARDGRVEVTIARDDLRSLLLAAASAAASQQGVTIQDLDVRLDAPADRSLAVNVRVKAKKLFMSGVINVQGRADVDEGLVATLSGLSASGEGVIGGMAAGMIQGKLKPYEGRRVSLMAFSLGDVALRDLKISTTPDVRLSATFGHKS
ncbi:MAG TPA: hypothetical protein VH475_29580 [Tepidisphaeraceae bacterium]|jgi:hypothetical protein